jgi:fatty-acyl-CoA synthase
MFDARASALAQHLLSTGLAQHERIGVLLFNAPEYLESYFAAFKVGLTPFNINYRYGPDELTYLLNDADTAALVFHASLAPALERIRARVPTVRHWIAVPEPGHPNPDWALDYETLVQIASARDLPSRRTSDDMLLMYTGGTTGMPKGVIWRHADVFAALGGGANILFGSGPLANAAEAGERARLQELSGTPPPPFAVIVAPLMHGTGQFTAFTGLGLAGTLAYLPGNRFDAAQLWSEIERLQANTVSIVGMAFATPMLEALRAEPKRWDLSCLRRIISSGTIWSAENKRGLIEQLPQLLLIDQLGSSEALGVGLSASAAGSDAPTARFLAGTNTAVFTEEGRRVAPGSGERGLLAISGPTPLGYHKDAEKSARTFRTLEGRRWSVPGDWATVDADGFIALLGRGSQVINTGGEKVFPEEVEEVIKRYPGVRDAAVVGLPDPRFGETICAVVELEAGASLTLAELSVHVKAALAPFKAPRQLLLAAVARQPNGKLDYAEILARALASVC